MNKKKGNTALYITLIFLLSYQLLSEISIFQRYDNVWLDFLINTQAKKNQPDPQLMVLDIDDLGLHWMNEVVGRWPWPRSVHAEMIAYLEVLHKLDKYSSNDSQLALLLKTHPRPAERLASLESLLQSHQLDQASNKLLIERFIRYTHP